MSQENTQVLSLSMACRVLLLLPGVIESVTGLVPEEHLHNSPALHIPGTACAELALLCLLQISISQHSHCKKLNLVALTGEE